MGISTDLRQEICNCGLGAKEGRQIKKKTRQTKQDGPFSSSQHPPSALEYFSLSWADTMSYQSENKECQRAAKHLSKTWTAQGVGVSWNHSKIISESKQIRFTTCATDPFLSSSVFFLLILSTLSHSGPEKQRPCIPKRMPLVRLFSSNTLFICLLLFME